MSQLFSLPLRGAGAALRRATLATLILGAGLGAAAAADLIDVTLDQAKVLQLPDKTATVIVGNPIIADVTMLKRNRYDRPHRQGLRRNQSDRARCAGQGARRIDRPRDAGRECADRATRHGSPILRLLAEVRADRQPRRHDQICHRYRRPDPSRAIRWCNRDIETRRKVDKSLTRRRPLSRSW